MDNLIAVALKAIFDKFCKDAPSIPVGDYNIDETVTIRVCGTVKKIRDEEYTPTTSIPYKKAFEMFLARMGFQREVAMEALVKCMIDAINGVRPADIGLEDYISVDEAEEIVQSGLERLPKKVKKGKTFVDATMAVIDMEPSPSPTLKGVANE